MSTPGELLEALGRQARARLPGGGEGATRTYRGRSVEELIPQIQRDLGAEAIVVRRREGLTGGVLGFFQHAYVEIEAMPGTPRLDVYDEGEDPEAAEPQLDAIAVDPRGAVAAALDALSPSAPTAQQPAAQHPSAPPIAYQPPPAPYVQSAYAAGLAPAPQASSPGFAAPAAPAAPAVPPRPALGYWPRTQAQPGTPRVSAPPLPAPDAGSAYVTAHLAALARANRARSGRRDPAPTPPPPTYESALPASHSALPAPEPARRPTAPPYLAPVPSPPAPTWPAPGPVYARRARASTPPAQEPVPSEQHEPWSGDSQEMFPQELPELLGPLGARSAAGERRTVAPNSQARARAGVAKSLRRYGISEELAHELIDGASAHALALAPRAGLAQGVRATLAQRIPVAPPLPTRGGAIVVVGAGGAGKTTCCAALLGAYRRSSSLPASFATIARESERTQEGTLRGGGQAGDELRMILSPYIVRPTAARSQRAMRALAKARKQGLAVLDTPNLSPGDRTGIRELASLLAELKPERVVVALPATLGATAAAQLLQGLRPLGANSVAVTHADETDQIGVAVEAACKFGLAPEYVLDRTRAGGWRLSRVDPSALAARLLP